MEMTTCNVCGKIFGAISDGICPTCRKLLDIVYDKARNYLRDNPKAELNARELAKAIGENERLVEMLMLEGRFESGDDGGEPGESDEDRKKKRLLEDLQKSLATPAQKAGASTYGSDRHGTGRER